MFLPKFYQIKVIAMTKKQHFLNNAFQSYYDLFQVN